MRRLLYGLVLLSCATSAAPPAGAPDPSSAFAGDTLDPQPPWSHQELRAAALQALSPLLDDGRRADTTQSAVIREMRVLAWHVTDDVTRPMRVERALVWLRLSGEPQRWALANLYRHPLVESTWRAATATHTAYFGARLYTAPPNNADVYALLDVVNNWRFEEDPGAPFIDADVRERTWQAVTGSSPTRLYPRERRTGRAATRAPGAT